MTVFLNILSERLQDWDHGPATASPVFPVHPLLQDVIRRLGQLVVSVEEVPVFKGALDENLEALFKASFTLAVAALQPAIAALGVHQSLKIFCASDAKG